MIRIKKTLSILGDYSFQTCNLIIVNIMKKPISILCDLIKHYAMIFCSFGVCVCICIMLMIFNIGWRVVIINDSPSLDIFPQKDNFTDSAVDD